MYQLIYGSSAVKPLSEEDLRLLLQRARVNNLRLGISGILLYYDQAFLQVLEGDEVAVEQLYAKISSDLRHSNSLVFCRGYVQEREFGEWSMAFHTPTSAEVTEHEGFQDIRRLTPGDLGNAKVRALFASFRKMTRLEMAI